MDRIRRCEPGKEYYFIDNIDHRYDFQTLKLDFDPQTNANRAPWPQIFESCLNALPPKDLCDILDDEPSPSSSSKPATQRRPKAPKRGLHYRPFSGSGNDADPFKCRGILHPLPPQEKIPGWQRISLMKYFDPLTQPNGTSSQSSSSSSAAASDDTDHQEVIDDDAELNTGCWAYEGVVLPGGMIMLGRWWSPLDDTGEMKCMGPFIFWNVDR